MKLAVGKGRILHVIECFRRRYEFLKGRHQTSNVGSNRSSVTSCHFR
jgi:hypothetical protein